MRNEIIGIWQQSFKIHRITESQKGRDWKWPLEIT